jgi:hypothetical protein
MSQEREQVPQRLAQTLAGVTAPSNDEQAAAIGHASCRLGHDGSHPLTTDQIDAVLMQSRSAFAERTLLNPAEDCWNDL